MAVAKVEARWSDTLPLELKNDGEILLMLWEEMPARARRHMQIRRPALGRDVSNSGKEVFFFHTCLWEIIHPLCLTEEVAEFLANADGLFHRALPRIHQVIYGDGDSFSSENWRLAIIRPGFHFGGRLLPLCSRGDMHLVFCEV